MHCSLLTARLLQVVVSRSRADEKEETSRESHGGTRFPSGPPLQRGMFNDIAAGGQGQRQGNRPHEGVQHHHA
jgi:hypothetical protein